MAKKNPMGGAGNGSFGRPSPGKDRKAMAAALKKAALTGGKERKAKAEAIKKAAKSGGSGKKKGQRHLASKYCNFNKLGQFTGYKKGTPKGYVYLPGSRYLTSTKNLRLLRSHSSDAQADFVRKNRGAVEKAIETASRAARAEDWRLLCGGLRHGEGRQEVQGEAGKGIRPSFPHADERDSGGIRSCGAEGEGALELRLWTGRACEIAKDTSPVERTEFRGCGASSFCIRGRRAA